MSHLKPKRTRPFTFRSPVLLCLGLVLAAHHAAANDACKAVSGAQRLPVVELYTSEGCSSCPPADQQLAELGRGAWGAAAPLALHVNFWDYLGWRDPYAQARFTERQRQLIAANGSRTLYTPHVFVSGQELRDRTRLPEALKRVAARPADWVLTLEAKPLGSSTWALKVHARHFMQANSLTQMPKRAPVSSQAPGVDLILAVTEDGLASKVRAGENAGELLRHSHVVREWWPSSIETVDGRSLQAEVKLNREQALKGLALVAFVQDRRTAEILQAVRLPGCIQG